ncbi:MAG: group II intron reverse transcriptase/maturase, partial [Myxococcales bacterium]|nr:group II intron reverse transcriptase/maturase [Myxococcales bacterium]
AWSTRMLAALIKGVQGGRWFSLMDKVYAPENLAAAWKRVRSNRGAAGVDGQSVAQFERDAAKHLDTLHRQLRDGHYRPNAVRRQWIEKPGTTKKRPLGIPTIRDRIVQSALRQVLEPIWGAKFADHSYGFRPRRSCKDALRRVQALLRSGHVWVVDADIQSYYDSIDHGRLLAELRREIADSRVLGLMERLLGQRVMDTGSTWTPEEGIPQGSSLGPLLANVFLHPIDKLLERGHFEVIRYADDLVIMCRSRADAQRALRRLRQEIESRGLTLHPEKTRVTSVHEGGFDFLGYHFGRNGRHPRKQSLVKLKDRVREITKRLNGKSLPAIIDQLNGTLRGWFEYFRHSSKRTFPPLDAWIRMRLRRIEQWRHRKRGNGRGKCHYRWTNEYFASLGLFTMTTARAVASRPPIGDH